MGKTTDETVAGGDATNDHTASEHEDAAIDDAADPALNPATTPDAPKPVVNYGVASIELHLIPGGRQILMSKKTLAIKLSRDPALEYADPNVRLVLAMAAGPDFVAGYEGDGDYDRAYAKATGQ